MPTDSLDRLERLFQAALMHPPAERAAFLDAACADDEDLRQELESLLRADEDESTSFLSTEGLLDIADWEGDEQSLEGRQIGPYTVLQSLGHGGMGDVYLVRRDEPFKQFLALKIIRRGMDTREVLQRFSMERQILASLNHPNIARLIDGGMTDTGLPYLVMEYIKGVPITAYCDAQRLGIRERLRLFQTVCRAVHYAHQNLVIHRDLKPSNILVTNNGRVKLLDFGIAKLLNPQFSAVTMPVTRTEFRMLTPEYASPEQIRGESLSTASDLYSLGVVLYELLTGHRLHQFSKRSMAEVLKIVGEEDPERPSSRVVKSESIPKTDGSEYIISPDVVSAARGMPIERIQRQLRGDLDNIVLMTLRKEEHRRYASAEQLAEDLERFLSGQPVVARPITWRYRVQKFAARNKTLMVAATLVMVTLITGLAASLWMGQLARQERQIALEALEESEAVSGFLIDLFEASDPWRRPEDAPWAEALLTRGVEQARALTGQPELQARMLITIADVYEKLGDLAKAESLLEQVLILRQTALGPHHPDVAESMLGLGVLRGRRGLPDQAADLYSQAYDLQVRILGEEHPAIANTLMHMSRLPQTDFDVSLEYSQKALALRRKAFGEEHIEVARAMVHLSGTLRLHGDLEGSESYLRQALALQQKLLGARHPDVVVSMFRLADLLRRDRHAEAERLYREGLDIVERQSGLDNPARMHGLSNLAALLDSEGRFDEAEVLYQESLTLRRRVFGEGQKEVAEALVHFGLHMKRQGRLEEAEDYHRQALAEMRRALGEAHPSVAWNLSHLGQVLSDQGELDEAEVHFREALALREKGSGPNSPTVADVLVHIGTLHVRKGNFAEAEDVYLHALNLFQQQLEASHPAILRVYRHLARLYEANDELEKAHHYQALLAQLEAVPSLP